MRESFNTLETQKHFTTAEWKKLTHYAEETMDRARGNRAENDGTHDPQLAKLEEQFAARGPQEKGLGFVTEALVLDVINNCALLGRFKEAKIRARPTTRREDVLEGADITVEVEMPEKDGASSVVIPLLRIDVTCHAGVVGDKVGRALQKFITENSRKHTTGDRSVSVPTFVLSLDKDSVHDMARVRLRGKQMRNHPLVHVLADEIALQANYFKTEWAVFEGRIKDPNPEVAARLEYMCKVASFAQKAHAHIKPGDFKNDKAYMATQEVTNEALAA